MIEICEHVGIGRSVLTNVFSGQRPIPTRVAQKFLDFVGMQADGSLNPDHAFIVQERSGNEDEILELMSKIFPKNAAGSVQLLAPGIASDGEPDVLKPRHGVAYFDGQFAVVVHSTKKAEPSVRLDDQWKMIDVDSSDVLLSINPLPCKMDVLKTVSVADFQIKITWEQVIAAGEAKGMDAAQVLQLINGAQSRRKALW